MTSLTTSIKKQLLLALVACQMSFWHAAESISEPLVLLEGETITVKADNIPLKELLHSLNEQGVSINIDPLLNPLVSASFSEQPVENALAFILRSYDHVLVWQKSEDTDSSTLELIELHIFEEGFRERSKPLTAKRNLDIDQFENTFYVKHSLLVKLVPGTAEEQLQALLTKMGADIAEPANEFGIVRVSLPDSITPFEAAEKLSGTSFVAAVEPDYAYRLLDTNMAPAVSANVDMEKAATWATIPLVAVLDSGLAEQYQAERFVASVYDALNQRTETTDPVGHGTQMSLLAAGVIQPLGVSSPPDQYHPIISIRAFDENGFTSNHTLMRSIDYALNAGAQVINMSWGTEQPSEMLEYLIDYAASRGAILVSAAGNTPSGQPIYPAAYDQVLGAGALNPDGSVWDQSNFGRSVSAWAPGVVVTYAHDSNRKNVYVGTSVSAAFLSYQIAHQLDNSDQADLTR